MELALVLVGLFILAAMLKNKDLSENEDNEGVRNFLVITVLFLVLGGLGFLLPPAAGTFPNMSYLVPIYVFVAGIASVGEGRVRVIATVATVALLSFVILGSFR